MPRLNLKKQKVAIGILQVVGNVETPDATEVTVTERDGSGYVTGARGITVPDGEAGYAVGATFVDTDKVGNKVYINNGTTGVADWELQGEIDAGDIAVGAVDAAAIGTDAVDSDEIKANAVGNAEMGDNAIGNAEMADNAIGNAEMADNAVGNAEMADNAVGNAELDDNAVGNAELQDNAVDNAELADNAVGNAEMADNAIGNAEMADDAVGAAEVADGNGAAGLAVQQSAVVVYDFAIDGGVIGVVALANAPTIPDNAVVFVESYDVLTTLTSEGADAATIKLELPVDGDLTTAIGIDDGSNPWDAGVYSRIAGALATPLTKKCTAARVPQLVIGGQTVTAGKVAFNLSWWVSQ